MPIKLVILVIMSVIAIGCGGTSAGGETSAEWKTVVDVVSALDKHTLSNKTEKAYAIVHAADGASYDVNPGGYELEFYVYKSKDDIPKGIEAMKAVLAGFGLEGALGEVVEGNVLLLASEVEETQIERLLAHLRD